MQQKQQRLPVATRGRRLVEITGEARKFLRASGLALGQMTLFCRHTSASLLIQENADPSVLDDLQSFFDGIAPEGRGIYSHDTEGPDDMPAHVRTMVTGVSLHVPVVAGALALGTWQGIYVAEHRARPHRREIVLSFIGSRRAPE